MSLFTPITFGSMHLRNRIVMAPMTRNRADADGSPSRLMVEYYRQRATAGLVIVESTPISPHGVGYPGTPGLYTDTHVAGWRRVTEAVHAEGGTIVVQLQHCGRISHPSLQPGGETPVAPSAIRPIGEAVTMTGMQPYVTPRAIDAHDIPRLVGSFADAARHAKAAGFDGVEVHAANGYLIDQFLRDGSNHRTDAYGGSVMHRLRFVEDVLAAVAEVYGPERIGVRISPENTFNDMRDSDPQGLFGTLCQRLRGRNLAYLHVLEGDMKERCMRIDYLQLRRLFDGPYLANNGYDSQRAERALREGRADAVAFGVPFIANPDLVHRLQHGMPLASADHSTFYGGGANGYTDYPAVGGRS